MYILDDGCIQHPYTICVKEPVHPEPSPNFVASARDPNEIVQENENIRLQTIICTNRLKRYFRIEILNFFGKRERNEKK